MRCPDFAVMVEVDDADAARELPRRRRRAGARRRARSAATRAPTTTRSDDGGLAVGLVDDSALVFGTETAFKVAVDASRGRVAGRERRVHGARRRAPRRPAGHRSSSSRRRRSRPRSPPSDVDPADAQVLEPLLGGPLSEPIAATLTATADAASVEFAAMFDSAPTSRTESVAARRACRASPGSRPRVPDLGPSARARASTSSPTAACPGAGEIERQVERATGLDLGDGRLRAGSATRRPSSRAPRAPGFSAGLIAETSDPEGPRTLLDVAAEARRARTPACAPAARRRAPTTASRSASRASAAAPRRAWSAISSSRSSARPSTRRSTRARRSATTPSFQDGGRVARRRVSRRPVRLTCRSSSQVAELGADGDVRLRARSRPYLDAVSSRWSPAAGSRTGSRVARLTVSLADE